MTFDEMTPNMQMAYRMMADLEGWEGDIEEYTQKILVWHTDSIIDNMESEFE